MGTMKRNCASEAAGAFCRRDGGLATGHALEARISWDTVITLW